MKVLHLLPTFGYSAAAHQAALVVKGLLQEHDQQLCVFDELGPWATSLQSAGVPFHTLGWLRRLDPAPLFRLRRLVQRLQPDRIHAWSLPALRTLALASRRYLGRTVLSHPAPSQRLDPRLGRLDRWLLDRVSLVAVRCEAEARLVQEAGVPAGRVVLVPPGVEPCQRPAPAAPPWPNQDRRTIVCFGPIERWKGFYQAIWAADFLNYAFPDTQLVIVGAGPDVPRLQWFVQTGVYRPQRIHFAGEVADPTPYFQSALACWAPAETWSGLPAVLEAQAAGCPVVVSDVPLLASVVRDGETGYLADPGTKNVLMRQTRRFLLDEFLRPRFSAAARQHARDNFSSAAFVQNCRQLYAA